MPRANGDEGSKDKDKPGEEESEDKEKPRDPLRRRAYSYGAVEDEDRESNIGREVSIGAATDISDLSEINDFVLEKFDLLTSTENVRRWIVGRPCVLPSTSDLSSLDPVRWQRSIEERLTIAGSVGQAPTSQSMKTREKLTIVMLAVANLCSMIVFSCIAPFFPEEAKLKGASETAIGFIFGIFELIIALVAPLFGRYLTHLGARFTFGCGLCVTGVTSILFGFLKYSPPGATFITLCFLVRSVEAVANAAFVTASFAIAASSFPSRVGTVIGVLETFSGLGYTVGPPIGGVLYELGGFSLPFWVLGCVLLLAGVSCVYLIPKQKALPRESVGNVFGLLKSARTWLMISLIFASNAGYAFLDPTLQPFLISFQLTPILIGLMFLLSGGVYAATAPLWGFLVDRKDWANGVMIMGSLCSFVSFLFIGPSPIFSFEKQLWLVALTLIIMGLGVGAQMIPPFQQCLVEAKNQGYPDGLETYGLVSSLFQSAVSLGAFFGPTMGGIAVEYIGFGWSTTIIAFLNLLCVFGLVVDVIVRRLKKKKNLHDEQSHLLTAAKAPAE